MPCEDIMSERLSPRPFYFCPDCGVGEGELHAQFPLCDQELCPICNGQLLSCRHAHDTDPVLKAGRIPFLYFPMLCAKCGAEDPDFFSVPDREWKAIVPKPYWDVVLCHPCYLYLAKLKPPTVLSRKKKPVVDLETGLLFP